MLRGKKGHGKGEEEEKVLDVDASMQGTLTFKDPVNLKISGKFEGNLDTKGSLAIGEQAVVNAEIKGDDIAISGKVKGHVTAHRSLEVTNKAEVIGDVQTPILKVDKGAILQGNCKMILPGHEASVQRKNLGVDELAQYLEVDKSLIMEWADQGKIPAQKEGESWKFDKEKVDNWVAREKVK